MERIPRTGPRPNIPVRFSTLRLGKYESIAHLCEFRVGFIDVVKRETVARRIECGAGLPTVSVSGHPLSIPHSPDRQVGARLDLSLESYTI
jgi:hypothetical protein